MSQEERNLAREWGARGIEAYRLYLVRLRWCERNSEHLKFEERSQAACQAAMEWAWVNDGLAGWCGVPVEWVTGLWEQITGEVI